MALKYTGAAKVGIEEADRIGRAEASAVYASTINKSARIQRTPYELKAYIFHKIPMPENRTEEDNIKFKELVALWGEEEKANKTNKEKYNKYE